MTESAEDINNRLLASSMPDVRLTSTNGQLVNLSSLYNAVVFVFPGIKSSDTPLPHAWHTTAGLKGCTAQSCGYSDYFQTLDRLGLTLYGVSTQTIEELLQARDRLTLPYNLLSDSDLQFVNSLALPKLRLGPLVVAKRLTLLITEGTIRKIYFPIDTPENNAKQVANDYASLLRS